MWVRICRELKIMLLRMYDFYYNKSKPLPPVYKWRLLIIDLLFKGLSFCNAILISIFIRIMYIFDEGAWCVKIDDIRLYIFVWSTW